MLFNCTGGHVYSFKVRGVLGEVDDVVREAGAIVLGLRSFSVGHPIQNTVCRSVERKQRTVRLELSAKLHHQLQRRSPVQL